MSTAVIAPAIPDDLARLFEIDAPSYEGSERRKAIRNAVTTGNCYVARVERRIVGFLTISEFFGFPFVALLVVDAPWRRRGVGTALIRHMETQLSNTKLFTSTNESNAPMQTLLASLGFERSGRIENLDEGDPELVYVKRL
jgi:ribosomal protein S18 acetylase RimI-like enzyme